jgi:hypothetical protein
MIADATNLLPDGLGKLAFHGTATCNNGTCVSVGTQIETGDLILANQVQASFKIPADEVLGVYALIGQALQQRYGT